MKKTIYLLNVNNYEPEISRITYPFIEFYAKKIGANIHRITKRKYPNFPVVYEKLQIYDIAKEEKSDWNIYIDSDTLVHPDFFDPTAFLTKDTVMHNAVDMANNRWVYDEYFLRDGRHIGSCDWFTIASDWCIDLWHPLENITLADAIANIIPVRGELVKSIHAEHLLDDYVLSRNIARYGLKVTTMFNILEKINQKDYNYLWHQYRLNTKEKVDNMMQTIKIWDLSANDMPADDVKQFIIQWNKEIPEKRRADIAEIIHNWCK